jgi:hypothetical protein
MTTTTNFDRAARALESSEILPLHGSAARAEKNVAAGVAAVLAYDAHVAEHLPHVDLAEIRALPDLARAVLDAAREAGSEDDEAAGLLDEAYALRVKLGAAALALVEAGVLGPRERAKVGSERGAVDLAAALAALASLFQRKVEELEGKTPLDEGDASRAAELATALRARWKPSAAARKPGPDGMSAVERRDRLYTLLVHAHERLWAVGAYVFGHAVDERVPALGAVPAKGRSKGA